MFRVKTARLNYSLLVSRPYHPFRSRLGLGPLRAYSMETPLPSHASLQGLNKEQLICAVIEQHMGRLQERWDTAKEKEALVKEQNTLLKEERCALLLANNAAMREKDATMREKDATLREMQTVVKTTEAKCQAELERYFYFTRYKDLRLRYLRQEDQFNLRGIIEYIASNNMNPLHGVQANLNDLGKTKAFTPCLTAVLHRLKLRREGVLRSCRSIYSVLSKHFHQHNLTGNSSDLVIDTTPGTAQVLEVLDGAALEVYLQYGVIPYTAVCKDRAVRFEIVGPGQLMLGVELPPKYNRKSWLDQVDSDTPYMRLDV